MYEIVFCVPHSDSEIFKRVRHEALVAVLRALREAGVVFSHRTVGAPE